MTDSPTRRLTVIGAGPVGLHAALRAASDGFDVTVVERGRVADAVRRWGHVKLFTPFSMNSTQAGRTAVKSRQAVPEPDQLLSGLEYAESYLEPLAQCDALSGRVLSDCRLVAASRSGFAKSQAIGRPERAMSPFRLLLRHSDGREEVRECDVLLDCTGLMSRHRFIGAGGIPCPGEYQFLSPFDYELAAPGQGEPTDHTVVVGSGYSAATSVCQLFEDGNTITWMTHANRTHPIPPLDNDPLPERVALTERANHLALQTPAVTWEAGLKVEEIRRSGTGLELIVSDPEREEVRTISCHRIVANPGFRPDGFPFEELQVHRCYATDGPIQLAAHLLGDRNPDCLQQTAPGVELLRNPEPDFFILGAASYGRDSRFLMQHGLEQTDQLFDELLSHQEAV